VYITNQNCGLYSDAPFLETVWMCMYIFQFFPSILYIENYVNVPPLDLSLSLKIQCTYFTEVGLLDVMLGHCVRTRLVAREMQTSCL